MPKLFTSKSKNNPIQSSSSHQSNQLQQNFSYPPDPNMMYADPYQQQQMMMDQNQMAQQQQMMMNENQMAQYQMGYYPPQSYPMILDESRQVSDSPKASPKSAKVKPKEKFSLFKSKNKEESVKKSKEYVSLPPINATEEQQFKSYKSVNQNEKIKISNPTKDDEECDNLVSPGVEVDDSRSSLDPTSGNINVVIRVRPPNALELRNNYSPIIDCANDGETLFLNGPDGRSRALTFNRVYNQDATQEIFFNQSGIKELMSHAVDGYSICIFAFGQTGSGKSFTITGPDGQLSPNTVGIIPRALRYLYEEVLGANPAGQVAVRASYLEIYNEHVYDLLNPKGPSLPIRWNAEKGFFVENLYVIDCEVLDDCLAILEEGLNNRTTASHRMNEHSSRSHSVMTIDLDSEFTDPLDGRVIKRHGKISFVDLAGSERVKESRAQGDTLTETLNINKSLLTLGKCIAALSDPRKRSGHIPYRDSKLTKLLSDSLGGNGMALMVACISPALSNITETVKTLRYAQSAKKIKNKPVINLDPREEMLYMLKREMQCLKKENDLLKNAIFSDPRYEELLNFITQGKHLADLPEISRGPAGKTNILYKAKEIGHIEDDYAGEFDKIKSPSAGIDRSRASANFNKASSNQSAGLDQSFRSTTSFRSTLGESSLEKYRQNRKFTPGLVENKDATNTWRNARSISRDSSRGRQVSRSSSMRDRSASASTRSVADSSRSSVTRADSMQRPLVAPKKSIMKRELSGRFDYNPVPDLNLNSKKNSSKVSQAPKEQSTSMSPQPDDNPRQNAPKTYIPLSENSTNDENSMKIMQRRAPELSDANKLSTEKRTRSKYSNEESNTKESKSFPADYTTEIHEYDLPNDKRANPKEYEDLEVPKNVKSKESKQSKEEEKKSRSKGKKKTKSPDDDIEPAQQPLRKNSKESDDKKSKKDQSSDDPKISRKTEKSTLDKRNKIESGKTKSESDDHEHLPDLIKLKKKTIADVIALDQEIARMS